MSTSSGTQPPRDDVPDRAAVALLRDGQTLAVRTSTDPRRWQPLAGEAVPGEQARGCAVRVVFQAVGVLLPHHALHLVTTVADEGGHIDFYTAPAPTAMSAPTGVVEAKWLPLRQACELPAAPAVREFYTVLATTG